MSSLCRSRAPWGQRYGLVLLMFMLTGLFLMHGLQASVDPARHTGITVAAGMPGMEPAQAMPAAAQQRLAQQRSAYQRPAHAPSRHQHAGGRMCLALLAMATLLILAVGHGRSTWRAAEGTGAARGPGRRHGRAPPPPSIFRLSVLRV